MSTLRNESRRDSTVEGFLPSLLRVRGYVRSPFRGSLSMVALPKSYRWREMPPRHSRHPVLSTWLRARTVIIAVAMAMAMASAPSGASTPGAVVPTISDVTVTPAVLPPSGGDVVVRALVGGATSCSVEIRPAIIGSPFLTKCSRRLAAFEVPGARHKSGITFRAVVTANGPGGSSTTTMTFTQAGRPSVMLFGDSVAYQDAPYVGLALGQHDGIPLAIHAFPGSSLCDWDPYLRKQVARTRPTVVILQFIGYQKTACGLAEGPVGSSGQFDLMRRQYTSVIENLLGNGVDLVEIVPMPKRRPSFPADDPLKQVAFEVASSFGPRHVLFNDAGASLLTPKGHVALTLPCLPEEIKVPGHCIGPVINGVPRTTVRADDGLHLCTVAWPTWSWPPYGCVSNANSIWTAYYGSGAFRMGRAISEPILARYGY